MPEENKKIVTARVRVTVDVDCSQLWLDSETMANVARMAEQEAVEKMRMLFTRVIDMRMVRIEHVLVQAVEKKA